MSIEVEELPRQRYDAELDWALETAVLAGQEMTADFRSSDLVTMRKPDGTVVTHTDYRINKLFIDKLSERFPDHHLIGEEMSSTDASLEMEDKWLLDPIDGTEAWRNAQTQCMISLALTKKSRTTPRQSVPVLGVLHNPLETHDQLLWVMSGDKSQARTVNIDGGVATKQIKVSDHQIADEPLIGISGCSSKEYIAMLLNRGVRLTWIGSIAYRGARIACGNMAGTIETRAQVHDIAAVEAIVVGAGGRVTDLEGQPIDYRQKLEGAIVSNGEVHDDLIEIYNRSEANRVV